MSASARAGDQFSRSSSKRSLGARHARAHRLCFMPLKQKSAAPGFTVPMKLHREYRNFIRTVNPCYSLAAASDDWLPRWRYKPRTRVGGSLDRHKCREQLLPLRSTT